MKTYILICALIAVVVGDDFVKKAPAEIQAVRGACWKELNLSPEFQESMKKYEYPDNVAIHEAVKCTGIKLGVWCEHEGFHKSDLIKQFGEGATPVIEKCISKKSDADTAERWAWHDWKCLIDSGLKEHFKNLEQ